MIEKYSCYEFEIFKELVPVWSHSGQTDKTVDGFTYKIYSEGCQPYDDEIVNSNDHYETEQEARFAAIGHVDLLEKQRGKDA